MSDYSSRNTLIIPRKSPDFKAGSPLADNRLLGKLMLESSQCTIFELKGTEEILKVYFDGEKPDDELTSKLKGKGEIKTSFIYSDHYCEVTPRYSPLPDIHSLSKEEQVSLLKKCADSITEFHKTGFVHLDIKIEHFMSDSSDRIHLIDFGLSSKPGNPHSDNISQFSPREAYSGNYCFETDLFMFGIAILDMYLNTFGTKRHDTVKNMILNRSYDTDALPGWLKADVQALLSDSPQERKNASWFRPAASSTVLARRRRVQTDCRNVINELNYQLNELINKGDPALFESVIPQIVRSLNNSSPERMAAAVTRLKQLPRSQRVTNYTNISGNVFDIIRKGHILTDVSAISKKKPIASLKKYSAEGRYYCYKKSVIDKLSKQADSISEQREKKAWSILKTIGLVAIVIAAVVVGIGVIAGLIYVVIHILLPLIGIILAICAIAALFG